MAHNIEALRERFRELLDVLCDKFNFGSYVEGNNAEDIEYEWSEYQDAADHYGIWTASGATKFVIGDGDCDYIIKFCPCSDYDYCAREVEVYEEAERQGFADKFAWCAKLFDYEFNDWYTLPVYVMEWCKCDYDMISDEMDDYHYTKFCSFSGFTKGDDDAYEKYVDSKYRNHNAAERMVEWAYSVWGLDFNEPSYEKTVAQFMREMSINDLHAGNWGWSDRGLVLTDYSGYGECLSCRSIDY